MPDLPEYELLSAYLDGELSAAEQAQVEQLLVASAQARQLLEELRALSSALKSLPAQKIGEDLSESVLRMAQRRMMTQSVSTETPVEPLSKTISRRLKNPRIWAWQAAIVAVALLLLLYNSHENTPPPGPGEREVAMAPKAEEDRAGLEKAPGLKPAAPETAPEQPTITALGKGHEEISPAPERARAVTDSLAERKSGETSIQPALGKAGSAKEGDAVQRQFLAKDASKAAFKAAAKGAPAAGTTGGQSAAFPSGALDEAQYRPGGTQIDESTIAETEAKPSVETKAGESKEAITTADELLIVNFDITSDAVKTQAFDKLLLANGIQWSASPEEHPDRMNAPRRETVQSLPTEHNLKSDVQPEGLFSNAEPLEIVYVEAQPTQIQSTISSLSSQPHTFSNVLTMPAKNVSQLESFAPREVRDKEIPKMAEGVRIKAIQAEKSADLQVTNIPQMNAPAPTNVLQGRAQRITMSAGINSNAEIISNVMAQQRVDLKRRLAETTQESLATTTRGSVVRAEEPQAGLAGGTAPPASVTLDQSLKQEMAKPSAQQQQILSTTPATAQLGSGASPQMQRAIFILRVVDAKQTPDNPKAAKPADAHPAK